MRFKLDENLGLLGKSLLEADGHDVMTVAGQQSSRACCAAQNTAD
jgi:hypothetical protein